MTSINNAKHHNDLPTMPLAVRDSSGRIVKGAGKASVVPVAKSLVAAQVSKLEAKRNAKPSGPSLKAVTLAEEQALANALVEQADAQTIVNPDAPPIVQALQAAAEAGCLKELVNAVFPSEPVAVSEAELNEALAVIARASKQQAEALRKAAAERKKVAPEGPKVAKAKPAKQLTEAQLKALEEKRIKEDAYAVMTIAAVSFIGTGLGNSLKMNTALTVLPLPAARWLARKYEIAIPKGVRTALAIKELLRVNLLTLETKV